MFNFLRKDKKIKINARSTKDIIKNIKTNQPKINNYLAQYQKYSNEEIAELTGDQRLEIFKTLTLEENCLKFNDVEQKTTFYFCLKAEIVDMLKIKYGLTNSDALEFANYFLTSLIVSVYQNSEPALMFLNALNIANVDRIMQHYTNLKMT